MTPDDWRTAMTHEAASVDDPRWTLDTRQAVRRLSAGCALRSALTFAVLGATQALLVQFVWATEPPAQLWPGVMLAVVWASVALARRGRSVSSVAFGALTYFPGAWLTVLALQWWTPQTALPSPGLAEAGAAVLVVLAACSAGTAHQVRALIGHDRT